MTLAPVAVFGGFSAISVSSGKTLDASRLFSSLALINLLATPLITCIQSLPILSSSLACFIRIQDFLNSDERLDTRIISPCGTASILPISFAREPSRAMELSALSAQTDNTEGHGVRSGIRFEHAQLAWSGDSAPCLHDVNVSIPLGSFNVLVGPSGCGKSAFLKSILGELSLLRGNVCVTPKDVAFADQNTWIRNTSLRANILGSNCASVRPDLLKEVVHACALDEDFGDRVLAADLLAGSRGLNLSGGQKQRVVS